MDQTYYPQGNHMPTYPHDEQPPPLPQRDRPSHWVDPTYWNGTHNSASADIDEHLGLPAALRNTANGPPAAHPTQSGRLSPLPSSHNELRQRLEAAGVPPDQIAAVLLQSDPSGVGAQPAQQAYVFPPPPGGPPQQSHYSTPPPQTQAAYAQPQRPQPTQSNLSYTTHNSISRSPSHQNESATPISFDICRASETTVDGRKKYTLALITPGSSMQTPSYTAVWRDVGRLSSAPQLYVYRNTNRSADESARKQVLECRLHHIITYEVEIRHPWGHWDKWAPEKQTWQSDVGTLDGAWMKWEYDLPNPLDSKRNMLRCVTTGLDSDGQPVGGLTGTETCRVIYFDADGSVTGRLEMPRAMFEGGGGDERRLDEMVSNAMVQFFRFGKKWSSGLYGGGGSSTAQNLQNANRVMANINNAANASGGGGGGC